MKKKNKLAYQSGLKLWQTKLKSLEKANRLKCKVCDTVEKHCATECPANKSDLCHRMLCADRDITRVLSTVEGIVNDLEEAHEEADLL